MASADTTGRPVAAIVASEHTVEGGGFDVHRAFPTSSLDLLDPFLLLDEMAPVDHPPGQAVGAPAHPHRGFETVTYILQGEVEHRDSAGNHGLIGPGDVQWMTAGDGIVHAEMPSARIQAEGGRGHGLQLWVNLPRSLRRTQPRYQSLPNDTLARAAGPGWKAEVCAGSILGATGPAETHTPVGLARLTVQPGTRLAIPVPADHNAALYGLGGRATVGGSSTVGTHELAVFERGEGDVVVEVASDDAAAFDALLMTGVPIGEPIARYGPFVMNTQAEIQEAIKDYRNGAMGTLDPVGTA
ncbi:MAG: pirin family protein [Actinomycetota bacterium]